MATTSNTYTGNGTNKLFSITFPYLDTSDINVYLNGVLQTITTEYTFANATTVEFVTAPANGATVLLDRSTDDTALQATFFPGSSIKANDLNFNFDQVLYLSQETVNFAANQSTAGLQTQITAATNTANTAITTANAASATANGIAATANTALSNSSAAVTTANAASVTATNADTTANAISATASSALSTANAAQSTANAALPKAGGTMTGVITYDAAQPRLVSGTSVASTSGTSVDFTGIPSWVKRVTVMFDGVSTNGGSDVQIQLGAGSITSSGYLGDSSNISGAVGTGAYLAGFGINAGGATVLRHGTFTISALGSNIWAASGNIGISGLGAYMVVSAGNVTLSGTLDRVRITTVNGTDTFDAGSINILYEG
jgi:hypothetical protein